MSGGIRTGLNPFKSDVLLCRQRDPGYAVYKAIDNVVTALKVVV